MTNFTNTQVTFDPAEPGWGIGSVSGYPCAGPISTRFGVADALHPVGHAGDDIAAPEGTPILAPADGVVVDVFAMPLRGNEWDAYKTIYGNAVILDHGDDYTIYMHMRDTPLVREGNSVKAGDVLGYVGSTGFSTGPHLHWGLWPKATERYPNYPESGPVGVLLDPFDYCKGAQSTPAPAPAPSVNVAMALSYAEAALSAATAAVAALKGN